MASKTVINPPKKKTRTRKKKVEVLVPALAEYIIQPNHVTNARYEYTLLQERIVTAIMYELQSPINDIIRGTDVRQLDLFNEKINNDNVVQIFIPLQNITTAPNYKYILPTAKRMVETSITFPTKMANKEGGFSVRPLLDEAKVPEHGNKRSVLEIYIKKDIAKMLIDISMRSPRFPVEYTRFVYQIAQNASSKYTSLLYKKICSWRAKGGFTISLENLYKDICVQSVYQKDGKIAYKDFKRFVLEKAKDELFRKADCWFEYVELYEGRSVKNIRFKVITPETEEMNEKRKEIVKQGLRFRLQLSEKQISDLSPLFDDENFNYELIMMKIDNLTEHIRKNRFTIHYPKAYAFESLQKMITAFSQG